MRLVRSACVLLMTSGLAAALSLGVASYAHAAADQPPADRRLERMIESLTSRIEQLERLLEASRVRETTAAPASPAQSGDLQAARPRSTAEALDPPPASAGFDSPDHGLPLHGFADVGAAQTRHAQPGQHAGFAVGSLDLYLTPELGANVKTMVEVNFGVSRSGKTEVDIERAQIGYAFNDLLTLWLGRFHTPFGYWNMAFHHGAQIQTSILRPRLLEFEDDGGILPVHTTGLWATGGLRWGPGRLVYNVYAGNGTRISDGTLNPNTGGDDNTNKVVGLGLTYRFLGALAGLEAGVNGSRQIVNAYDGADVITSRTRVGTLGAHMVYASDEWETIAEYYRWRNQDLGGGRDLHYSAASYAQIGRTLADRWTPYYRFEKATLDQSDTYFAAQANGRSYTRHVLGLRLNVDPRAAVKFEVNRTSDEGIGHSVDELRFQYAISF